MNNPIFIIARLTFREAIRRRIVQAGLVLGVLFLIVFNIGFHLFTGQIYPLYASCKAAMSNFFILRNALVTHAIFFSSLSLSL